jgi:hypothetical protein
MVSKLSREAMVQPDIDHRRTPDHTRGLGRLLWMERPGIEDHHIYGQPIKETATIATRWAVCHQEIVVHYPAKGTQPEVEA